LYCVFLFHFVNATSWLHGSEYFNAVRKYGPQLPEADGFPLTEAS
jgi:hypothetical protein